MKLFNKTIHLNLFSSFYELNVTVLFMYLIKYRHYKCLIDIFDIDNLNVKFKIMSI